MKINPFNYSNLQVFKQKITSSLNSQKKKILLVVSNALASFVACLTACRLTKRTKFNAPSSSIPTTLNTPNTPLTSSNNQKLEEISRPISILIPKPIPTPAENNSTESLPVVSSNDTETPVNTDNSTKIENDFFKQQNIHKSQKLQRNLNKLQDQSLEIQQEILNFKQDISSLSQEIDQISQNTDSLKQGMQVVEQLNLLADPEDDLTIYNLQYLAEAKEGSIEWKSSKTGEKVQFLISKDLYNDLINNMMQNPQYSADIKSHTIKARDFKGTLTFPLYCKENDDKELVVVSPEKSKELDLNQNDIVIVENESVNCKMDDTPRWKKMPTTNGKSEHFRYLRFELTWDGITYPSVKISQIMSNEEINKKTIANNQILINKKQKKLEILEYMLQEKVDEQKKIKNDILEIENKLREIQSSSS